MSDVITKIALASTRTGALTVLDAELGCNTTLLRVVVPSEEFSIGISLDAIKAAIEEACFEEDRNE